MTQARPARSSALATVAADPAADAEGVATIDTTITASIRRVAGVGIGIVLTCMAIIVWAIVDARHAVLRQAEQAANNISLTLERDIERVMGALDLSIQAAIVGMALPSTPSLDPEIRQAMLFDGAVSASEFGGLVISDDQGRVLYASVPLPDPPRSISDRDYFDHHRGNADLGLHVGAPVQGGLSHDWVLPISRRYNRPDGSFAGVVSAGIRISFIHALFDGLEIGEHGVAALLTSDSRLVAGRPFVASEVGAPAPPDLPRDALLAGQVNLVASSPNDGMSRIYSIRHFVKFPLTLVIGFDTDAVYTGWTARVLAIAFLLTLLVLAGAFLAGRLWREIRGRAAAEQTARRADGERNTALARLNAVFSHTEDTMLVATATPDGFFTYEAVNPVWSRLSGVPREAAIGRTPQECLPPHICDTVMTHWRACLTRRESVRYGFTVIGKDGATEWDALVVPVFDDDGAIHRLIATGREVTERNRMQARLVQSQRLEAVGQVAAGVAHDFNNILQAIMGSLEFVRATAKAGSDLHQCAAIAFASAERGALLTRHLLAAARKQMLSPQSVDLSAYLDDLGRILQRMLGPQIALAIDVAPDTPPLFVDPGELETALLNLAVNAAHAMAQGGVLRITACAEAERGDPSRRYILLAVSDTGSGMDAETLMRATEPFFTTKGANGSGLGLSQVKGFSEQSGGQFRIESHPGRGTRVELRLPCVAGAAMEPTLVSEPSMQGRLLLVDDAPDVLSTTAALLASAGLEIVTAESGAEALAILSRDTSFEALITDHAMPGMTGIDLIQAARAIQPGLAAVLITGFAELGHAVSLPQGVHLLRKPFRRASLVAAIAEARSSRRGGSAATGDRGTQPLHTDA